MYNLLNQSLGVTPIILIVFLLLLIRSLVSNTDNTVSDRHSGS